MQTQTPNAPSSGQAIPGAAAPAPPALPQSPTEQMASLVGQVAGLQVQRNFLADKIARTPLAGRPPLQAQIDRIDAQIANARAQLASLEASTGARQGHRNYTRPPFLPGNPGMNDNQTALAVVFVLAVLMPLSLGITRSIWRRSSKPTAPTSQDPIPSGRLERLEQAVDAIAIEVERISEGQRFVTKILAERPAPAQNSEQPLGASALGADKPLRALGAGPIEPIVAAEKQRVRQSITPH